MAALIAASPASAAGFTWTGAAPLTGPSSVLWSNAQNWAGGAAPSGAAATLSFPRLTTPGCASMFSSTNACYDSSNDLSGLSVGAISLDNSAGYTLTGNAITLGSGGLNAAPGGHCPCGFTAVGLPITLGTSQAWSIDRNQLTLSGALGGSASSLRITTSNGAQLVLGASVEVGPVTLVGANSHAPSQNGQIDLLGGSGPQLLGPHGPPPPPTGQTPVDLNGQDGNPVTVSNTSLFFATATVGPLTSAGGEIAGMGSPAVGSLTVNGGLTVDKRSAMAFFFDGGRYTRITASGPVSLGGATLFLDVANAKGFGANQPCPSLAPGTLYTPLSTSGTLTGRFGSIASGDRYVIPCVHGFAPIVRIAYTAHAFQMTVLPAHGGVLLPQSQAPVARSGRGSIFVACDGPAPCFGKLILPRGMAQYAPSYVLGPAATAESSFQLTAAGLRQLRRHHGHLRIGVRVLPKRGRAFNAREVLTLH